MTEGTVTGHYDVSFVGTPCTSLLSLPVDGSAEEMGSWIYAGGIDIVVLGIFAHFD